MAEIGSDAEMHIDNEDNGMCNVTFLSYSYSTVNIHDLCMNKVTLSDISQYCCRCRK